METVGLILLCAILVVAAYFFGRVGYAIENDKKEKSDYEKMNEAINEAVNKEDNQTRNLLLRTLKNIGCQYEVNSKDNIIFKYQGEEFLIEASNGSAFIMIWDLWWSGLDLDSSDVDKLKRAINETNLKSSLTTLYSIDEEDNKMGLHSKCNVLFIAEIPNIELYLKANLESFFTMHQIMKKEFDNLQEKQDISNQEKAQTRVVVKGFN